MLTRTAARRGLVLAGASTITAVIYAALPGATLGSGETRANATTLAQGAAVARDAGGDYVVVWSSTTATESAEVYFQRFDAKGAALGEETVVNTTAAGSQAAPAVAMDATGNFAIVWSGNGTQADQADATGVFLQRFDAEGAPLGEETRVNTTTTNTQDLPAVAMDAGGNFVVVWQSLAQDGSGQGVYAQRFDAAGALQGSEFQVNAFTTGSQRDAAVAMDFGGNFVVAWESNGQDGSLNGVYARLFAADGTEAAAEFRVNTLTADNQENPAVGRAGDGGFVVAWSAPDADASGIYARRFDSLGGPLDSSEFAVNATPTATQAVPAIALDADGDFVVAWESNSSGNYDVVARRYTAAGVAGSEGEFTLNSTVALDQRAPAVALDADGDSVVAWQGNGSGDANGLFARRAVGPQAVDLSLTKTDSPDHVVTGNTLTYTITVANLHPAATPTGIAAVDGAVGSAAAVVVSDTLPTGLDAVTLIEATGEGWECTNSAGTVTCALGSPLPADTEAAPIEISVLAPAVAPADRTIVNTASVSSAQYDDVPANDSDTDDTAVCGAGEGPGTLNVTSTSAGEAAGTGPVTVTRTGGTCGAVSVQVNLAAGTATTTADFTATSPQTLEWANGETGAKSVATPITLVEDTVYENNETVAVTLSNPLRATAGVNGTFTIMDNEAQPSLSIGDASIAEGNSGTTALPLTVTLTPAASTSIGRDVAVRYDTANGTATTADGDYVQVSNGALTFTPGQTTKTVNVSINGDAKNEADETLQVNLSNANGAVLADAQAIGTVTNDDALPAVAFALADSSVSETGTGALQDQDRTLDVQVTLSTASAGAVSVTVGASGTATAADYSYTPATVSFAAGETSKNVVVTAKIDALDEDDETVVLSLSAPSGATLGTTASHTVTITDDDATPTLSISAPSSINENANPNTVAFTASLSAESGRDVSFNFAMGGGGAPATLNTDYTVAPAPGTLTIAAGSTSTTIVASVTNDALDEENEIVRATLSGPQNATLATASDDVSINDEDAEPQASFDPATQAVDEDVAGGTATVTVRLNAVSGRTVQVPFTINPGQAQGGDASNGGDFSVATASPLTFPAGSDEATITLTVVNDGTNEADENIRLGFGTLVNATAGTPATHVATIVNDDTLPQASFASAAQSKAENGGAATVSVQLSRAAEQDVTISYSLSGTALAGGDYTVTPASPIIIAEGESAGTLTITPVNDSRVETDETAILTLTGAVNGAVAQSAKTHTATLTNDDSAGVTVTQSGGSTDVTEGGSGDSYMLVLTSEPSTAVTISATGSGQATITPPSVTFTPDGATAWNIPQSIALSAVDDMAGEGAHGDTVSHLASSGDADYDGIAVDSVTVNVTDNDVPAIIIAQSSGGTTVTEGGATDSYEVSLSAMPAQDVTISFAHDAEVTLNTASLTFTMATWNVPQPVTVTAFDDAVAEGTHLSTIAHSSASTDAGFNGLGAEVAVQITDDETASVVLSKTSAVVTEGGAGDTYTVRLSSQPVGDVVVSLTPSAQVAVDVDEIVFNAVNWNLDVGVTVAAVDDTLDEASPHDGAIAHAVSATASDANYDGIAVDGVAVAVTDNDAAPGVALSLAGSPLNENGGVATVTATLSAPSAQAVTVNLAFGGSAAAPDYVASASSITIAAGSLSGSITLTGVDDALDEANEGVAVDISSVSNGTETGTQQAVATILDNDAAPGVTLSLAGSPLAENGGVATVTATLSAASGQAVTVNLGYGGTAAGADYAASAASIVIPAGSTAGSVTLTGSNDALDEAAETIVVGITTVTNGTETGTQEVLASITDDDAAPGVTLSLAGSPLAENGGVATITATLSAASGQPVTVNLALAGTALSGTDYAAFTPDIVIAAGQLTGARTLSASNDVLDEADETVTVAIDTVTNGTETGTQQVVATITDDDVAPTVTLSAAPATIAETGGSATLTATLSAASGQAVTVSLAFSGTAASPGDYTASASAITIAAGATSGSITLSSVADGSNESNETIVVDVTSVTNGTESGTQTQTVTITDDDSGGGGGSWSWLNLWLLAAAFARRRARG